MKRALEPFVFLGLALGLHIAIFVRSASDEGADAAGADGAELVSIQASSASIEAMVDRWSEPPLVRTSQTVEFDAPQVPAANDLQKVPVPQDFAFQTSSAVGLEIPTAPNAEDLDFSAITANPHLLEETPVKDLKILEAPEMRREIAAVLPKETVSPARNAHAPVTLAAPKAPAALLQNTFAAPVLQSAPLLESVENLSNSARPMKRPDRPKPRREKTPTPAPKSKKTQSLNSEAQIKQTAAGQGGGARAGATASAETSTLSMAKNASLIAKWGGRVRAQIERRKRYPNSARGAEGTTRLAVTVSRTGRLIGTRITKTSGNAALDSAAVAAVKATRRYAKAPGELQQQQVTFNLSISFQG